MQQNPLSLPEIRQRVFSFLFDCPRSKNACALVCRQWYLDVKPFVWEVIGGGPAHHSFTRFEGDGQNLCENFYLVQQVHLRPRNNLLGKLLRIPRCNNIQVLTAHRMRSDERDAMMSVIDYAATTYLSKASCLRELEFVCQGASQFSLWRLFRATNNATSLRKLSLDCVHIGCYSRHHKKELEDFIAVNCWFPNLESLELGDLTLGWDQQKHGFDVEEYKYRIRTELKVFFLGRNISSLAVTLLSIAHAQVLAEIVNEHCPKLSCLTLKSTTGPTSTMTEEMTDMSFSLILGSTSQPLTRLAIHGGFHYLTATAMANHFDTLTDLSMSGNGTALTDSQRLIISEVSKSSCNLIRVSLESDN